MLLRSLGTFFLYAIIAVSAENAVLSRSLGISRLVRLIDDDNVDTVIFGAALCVISLVSSVMAFFINKRLITMQDFVLLRPLVLTACVVVAFLLVLFILSFFYEKAQFKHAVNVLPLATFNATVLGSLLITTTQSFTFWQTVGFALGTGAGYVLAVLIVTQAQEKLRSKLVPKAFRGLPATLIYIGVLAIAIYAFTGHMMLI